MKDPPIAFEIWKDLEAEARSRAASSPTAKPAAEPVPGTFDAYWGSIRKEDANLKKASRFWVTLVPFGVGHFDSGLYKDGFLFLGGELLALAAAGELRHREHIADDADPRASRDGIEDTELDFNSGMVGSAAFAGVWGHELYDLLPEMNRRDPKKTEIVRYALSFVPFGVGQRKNNEPGKALGFAGVEAALLTACAMAPEQAQRNIAATAFFAVSAYGAYDGWANHVWNDETGTDRRPATSLFLAPTLVTDHTTHATRPAILGSLEYRW